MPPKAVNALEGVDFVRHQAARVLLEKEKVVEKKTAETRTFSVFRKTGTVKKSWKDTSMSLDGTYVGNCTFSDGGEVCVRQAQVDVPWIFGEQKYYFTITDTSKTITTNNQQEFLYVLSPTELDKCLAALESHGALIHRPLKTGFMSFTNKKKEEAWFVLYNDGLQTFKLKTDQKPMKVVLIAEASELERVPDGFMLSESGDEATNSITCFPGSSALTDEWYEVLEQAVTAKRRTKCFDSIKEGYLNKCNADMKYWKKRYFVLMADHMKYFKKRVDDQPAGIISLPPGAEVEGVDDSVDPTHPNMFWVAENGDEVGTRRFFMTAPSVQEKQAWVQSLSTLFSHTNFRAHPTSIKEGYLYHLSSGNLKSGKWNKHFFVVQNDCIMYFRKRTDTQPLGSIDLGQGPELTLHLDPEAPVSEQFVMIIKESGDEQSSSHYMRPSDDSSKRQWLTVLSELFHSKESRVHMLSVKEGYMFKQNSHQKWNKRYFILLDNKLMYYKRRQDKVEAGEIPLPGSSEIAVMSCDDPNYKWMFSVAENGDESGVRTYFMACESEALRTQWMNVLTKIVRAKDSRILMGSLLEGYLWKCPEGGGVWRKRYFVLKQHQLMYFRKRADPSSAGCIEVKGEAQITAIDDDPEHPFSFSVARSGDEGEREVKIYALDALTREEWLRCLRQQAALLTVRTKPDSIREGYMNIWTGLGWRRRFYVLEKDALKLFNKRHDQTPSSSFVFDSKTVVLLEDTKTSPEGSLETKAAEVEAEEKKAEGEKKAGEGANNEGDDDSYSGDRKPTGASVLICNNGDQNSRKMRCKVMYDSEANFLADAITMCLAKEFPPVEAGILKSAYLSVRHKPTGLGKVEKWVPCYVTLMPDNFFVFKGRDDEAPLFSASVEITAMFWAGPVPGSAVWNALCMTIRDVTEREISFVAQTADEKTSWMNTVLRSIELLKDKRRPSRLSLFGGEVKASFAKSAYYGLPSVVATCVDFLRKTPASYCLLRNPGSHPVVRSVMEDFENGLDLCCTDPDSVAFCLRTYLLLLKTPLLSDACVQNLVTVLTKATSPNDPEVIRQFQQTLTALPAETKTTLSLLLRYLMHEIKRPEEVHLTIERAVPVWAPLFMRFKVEGATEDPTNQVLTVLLRNLNTFFPGDLVLVKKLSRKKLQALQAEATAAKINYDILRGCKYGKALFAKFVRDNHIDEDVLFLAAVQEFKDFCEHVENTPAQRHAKASAMYNKFVKQGAETQVNVADATSKLIQERLEGKKNLQGTEFYEAEAQAILLINTNSWPRFKKDEAYDHWLTYREQVRVQALGQPEPEPDAQASADFVDRSPGTTPAGSPHASPRHSFVDEPPPPPPDDVLAADTPVSKEAQAKDSLPPPVRDSADTPRNSADKPPIPRDSTDKPDKPPKPPKASDRPPEPPKPDSPKPAEPPAKVEPGQADSPQHDTRSTPRVPNRPAPMNRAPSRLQLESPASNSRTVAARTSSPSSLVSPPTSPTGSADNDDMPPPPPPDDSVVWFMRKTTKGVAYYINTVTKATTYHAPAALIFSIVPDADGKVRFANNRDDTLSYEVPEPLQEFARTSKLQ